MARELSQEALLDFLCQAGGRVTNATLLSHFKGFLRDPSADPSQHQQRRELFKGFVNSVAAVRQDPDGTKYVVLKRRYRDLLGEEGLQRPREPPAAVPAGGPAPGSPPGARRGEPPPPQSRRRRRERKREEEPAGAAAPAPDAGCNGLPASGAREERRRKGSPSRRSPAPVARAIAAQVGTTRCAAAETRGRCCWECQQNDLGLFPGESPAQALPDSAIAGEEPARAPSAPGDRGGAGQPQEGAPTERARVPETPRSPPDTGQAAGSRPSPPAFPPCPIPSGDPPELMPRGSPNHSTQQLQQLRTQEWVARHPRAPEARDQGPTRAWSVLPDNFLQLSSGPAFWVLEPNSARSKSPLPSPCLRRGIPEASSESWSGNHSPEVFRSIRCQLSLQDLHDFVDQESHGSEESSSGPKESPGGSEERLPAVLGTPDWEKPRNPTAGLPVSPKGSSSQSPGPLRMREDGRTSQQVRMGAKDHPQEPLPWPAPRIRRSLRRSSGAGRAKLSSSDEEYLDEGLLKRNRRPPRSRKPSKAGLTLSPRVDAALTYRLTDIKAVVTDRGLSHTSWGPSRNEPTASVPRRSEHKSPLVPLDAREHEWIVKLASGSWVRVLTLFQEDPQLALHKDFLTGYTALHWIAKHGDLWALQDLVSGAQKAGIALDVNVRSGCGYTPLHLAAIHSHDGVIKLLVQRLASRVNIRDSSGKKPWQYLTSNTSGEIWQLLGAPRGKPIFPVYSLVRSPSPTRKAKSRDVSRHVTRKTSLAAKLKHQHSKWKSEKFHAPQEREEYSD
ncbi:ankyrin repeat domain-containing protein SOWAHB [Thomomys bottae]